MKTTKLFLIPLMLIFLVGIVSAASVTVSLFYDSTTADSLTINNGDSVEVIVSADSIFENSMTIKLDLIDSSGNIVSNILDTYTTEDSYSGYVLVGLSAYNVPGTYTLNGTVTGASGQIDIDTLSLTVLLQTPGNNVPVITSVPTTQINESQDYSYQIIATDADEDALTYSLTQNPSWLSISSSGLISGTAPDINSDYSYAIALSVSDGTDSATQSFSIIVRDTNQGDITPPVITVVSPINGQTYGYTNFLFEITTNENAGSAWYVLDSGSNVPMTSLSGSQFTQTAVLSDGSHSIIFYATDLAGNTGQSNTINFNVDTSVPDTTAPIVLITSPIDGREYSTRQITVNFNATDLNLNQCSYSLNNAANITTACNIAFIINATEGTNILAIYATDLAGNVGSQNITFNIDTSDDDDDDDNDNNSDDQESRYYGEPDEADAYLNQFNPKTTAEEEIITLNKKTESSFWQKLLDWLKSIFSWIFG